MKNKYETFSREQLIDKILKLEKERYGLVWPKFRSILV